MRPLSRSLLLTLVALAIVGVAAAAVPADALAAGNDVGQNLGRLMRHYAAEMFAGILGIFSLVYLVNRRFGELGMFLFAAIVVGWMVFSPDSVADAARSIAKAIFG